MLLEILLHQTACLQPLSSFASPSPSPPSRAQTSNHPTVTIELLRRKTSLLLAIMAQKSFASSVPDFDDLPKVEGMPQGCAWGVFDRDGTKDALGTLNFLTPDVVLNASAEIKDGHSISLK